MAHLFPLIMMLFVAGCSVAPTPSEPIQGVLGGLHYVWWHFYAGSFREVTVSFTIHEDFPTRDGMYLQMYQSEINGIPFYFGIQTRVGKPGFGLTGKGVIFSRWGTRDLTNAEVAPGGWTESAGYEGDFISVRKGYDWKAGKYTMRIAYVRSDTLGDWYGVWIGDENAVEEYAGSLRFPRAPERNPGIADGGGTWTEIYYRETTPGSTLPRWWVSVEAISGVDFRGVHHRPRVAILECSERFQNVNIVYDASGRMFHFLMGEGVEREFDRREVMLW
uniref:DUF3472 domain-containing protein n=1 Tax=Candidatus Caldatribacterium saccharofermentans TaxID=1454753 RepID=A0A7V4TX94_9BACT